MAAGIADSVDIDINEIKSEIERSVRELIDIAKLEEEDIFVVGCSSSEIAAHMIGTYSSEEIGKVVFTTIKSVCDEKGIFLAAQCCEHLNRAVIVEKKCAQRYGLTRVNVVPVLKAGGSFGTAAYNGFENAYAVESLERKATAGMDIGDTFIGMHMRDVVVPVRVHTDRIGNAHVTFARTRAKFVGGDRAVYNEDLK
jgi:uncharacterized protein (TIGR01440 family)